MRLSLIEKHLNDIPYTNVSSIYIFLSPKGLIQTCPSSLLSSELYPGSIINLNYKLLKLELFFLNIFDRELFKQRVRIISYQFNSNLIYPL